MKTRIAFLGLMMVSTLMFAQRKVDPIERAGKLADKMKTELSLDDVQYKSVKAIQEEYAAKLSSVRKDSTLSKETKRDRMKTLRQEEDNAIGKVLTDEQKTKWATYRSDRKKNKKGGMARHNGEHAKRMQKNLELTDEQTSQLKAIDKEFAERFRALKKENAVAQENIRQRAQQLKDEYLSKTKSVLTEEQYQKWESQRMQHKRKKL